MIRLTNCTTEIEFASVKEASVKLGISEQTIYNKRLPCDYGGFFWQRISTESKRHVTCTRCGVTKWNTEFYKSSKQNSSRTSVNQPCKQCTNEHNRKRYQQRHSYTY